MTRRDDAPNDLLFGLLAFQTGLISQNALVAAFHAWALARDQPMGAILAEHGALDASHLALVGGLVDAHLKLHGGDPEKSLAALGAGTSTRERLTAIGDPDLDSTLARVGPPPNDLGRTGRDMILPAGGATSAGQRFRIVRNHAKGGLGEVFVAVDAEFNREVALKEIKLTHAHDPVSRARFLLEAEITGGLEHPGIVPVYGLGTYADGRPFYAMRFIQGDSLKEAIAAFHAHEDLKRDPGARSLELRKLLRRFLDVCNAIEYAHQRGVLHRDLKPGNIMVGRYGETLVVDWGLAKAQGKTDDESSLKERALVPHSGSGTAETLPGFAQGTPGYMSPEQAAGDLDRLGPRSDVYSLGATLYSLLTGKPPFEGRNVGVILIAVKKGDFRHPRQVDPSIDAALEAVCLKAMSLKPEDRYESPRALADDIEKWSADEPVTAHQEGLRERLSRWTRRHRAWVQAGTVLLAFLVVVAVLVAVDQGRAADRLRGEQKKTEKALTVATEQTEFANRRLYCVNMNLVQRSWEDYNPELFRQFLDDQLPGHQAGRVNRRGFEWYYWERKIASGHRTFKGHTDRVITVAFSPVGNRIASAGDDGTVNVWDMATGRVTLMLKPDSPILSVAFSPDGTRIASAGYEDTVRVWDAVTGQQLLTLKGHTDSVLGVAFSPDGKHIASVSCAIMSESTDRTVRVWDAFTGQEIRALKGHTEGVTDVVYSPDGTRIASASYDKTVRVWDAVSGQYIRSMEGHTDVVFGVAYSPDSKRIASVSHDKTLRIWDAVTGQQLLTLKGHTDMVNRVAFSPDGTRITTASDDETVRVWDAITGEVVLTLKGHGDEVYDVAYSPDGQRIASVSADQTVRVWNAVTGQEDLVLKGHTEMVNDAVFSPDGQCIASAGEDKAVRVWSAVTGQEIHALKGHTEGVLGVVFSPDGQRIASTSGDKTVRVWDAVTGQDTLTLKGHTGMVLKIVFSPDGQRIASAGEDKTVRVWDTVTGQETFTLKGHTDTVDDVAFSPDGKSIASASRNQDKTVRVWDTASGRERVTLKGHTFPVVGVAFSPDGTRIATASYDHTVRVWDAATGQEILTLKGHTGQVASVTFSPDGTRIASASFDQTVRVWNAITGQETLTLKGHTGMVLKVVFSPDGQRIVSAGADKTLRVWDAITGQETLALKGHTGYVNGVVFNSDGTRIVSFSRGMDDRTVRVWDARPLDPADRIASRP